jgi:t-SNARE complex subunit (syntaxin)
MSFDRLPYLESQPTTTRRRDDPAYRDDPEYAKLTETLSTRLFELTSNISRLSQQISLLGTKRDTERVRERVHDLLEETKEGFKEVGEGVKKVQGWEDLNVSIFAAQSIFFSPFVATSRKKYSWKIRLTVNSFQQASQKYTAQKISREFGAAGQEFQVIQRRALEKDRASKAALEDTSSPTTSASNPDGRSGQQQQQQQQLDLQLSEPRLAEQSEVDFQENLIIERESEIRNIEQGVSELNELFRDVATIVREQGDMIDAIDVNVENVRDDTRGADVELGQASRYQKRARNKACCLLVIMAVVLVIIILAVVLGWIHESSRLELPNA